MKKLTRRAVSGIRSVVAVALALAVAPGVSVAQELIRSKIKSDPIPEQPINCPDIFRKLSAVLAASRSIKNPSEKETYDNNVVRAQKALAEACANVGGGGSPVPGASSGSYQASGGLKNGGSPSTPAAGSVPSPSAPSPAPPDSGAFGKTYQTSAGANHGAPAESSVYSGNDGSPLPQPAPGQGQSPQSSSADPGAGGYGDYVNTGHLMKIPTPKSCPGKDEPLSYPVGPGYIGGSFGGNNLYTFKIKRPNRMDYVRDWYWTIPGGDNAFVATRGQFTDGGDVIYFNFSIINFYSAEKQFQLLIKNLKTGAYLDHQGIFIAVNSYGECRHDQPGARAEMCKAARAIGSNAGGYSMPVVSVNRKDPNILHPIRFFDPGTGISDASCGFPAPRLRDCMLKLDPPPASGFGYKDGDPNDNWESNWQDMPISIAWPDSCDERKANYVAIPSNAETPPSAAAGGTPSGAAGARAGKYPTCPSLAITTLWTPYADADPRQPHCTLPETSVGYDGWCFIPSKPYPCRANKYGSYSCDYDMNDWSTAEICAKKCNTTDYAMGMKCTSNKAMGGWIPETSNHCEDVNPHQGCRN